MVFKDRHEAGKLLSDRLTSYDGTESLVLGLARGGIIVASEIARKLHLPLDILVVKKIPSPVQPELAIGALAPDGVFYVDWRLAHRVGADEEYVHAQILTLAEHIKQKTRLYRKGRRPLETKGKTVLVIDDGAATGATLLGAIRWLKKKNAATIVAAVPVAPSEVERMLRPHVDKLVITHLPVEFSAVGQFYKEFPQVEDEEVVELLTRYNTDQRMRH